MASFDFLSAGLGEVLFDMIEGEAKLGGAPANFAWHCHELGSNAVIVSAVGQDELGEWALAQLKPAGLAEAVASVPYPTGQVTVSLDTKGNASYNFLADTAYDHLPCTKPQLKLATCTSIACFGTLCQRSAPSRHAILEFLQAMPQNCLRIFDVNLRQSFYTKNIIEDSLRRCEILKLNEEELEVISKLLSLSADPDRLYTELKEHYGLYGLVLTLGADGSMVYLNDQYSRLTPPRLTVADTVGAGDSFTATLALGLYRGIKLEIAHELATEVSAYVCSQRGAMVSLPIELKQAFEDAC